MEGSLRSYWLESAQVPSYASLDRDIIVDVAVIGAGIVGVSTAWELNRAGASVVLLEGNRVLSGVSGHTTAKLTALHTLKYFRLSQQKGVEATKLYAQSQQSAVEHVAGMSDIYPCDFERAPAYTYVTSLRSKDAAEVMVEVKAARAAGLAASVVTQTELPFDVFRAVRVGNQAQFHPVKYLSGLLSELTGKVSEGAKVVSISDGSDVRVFLENGVVVRCRAVVVATQFPIFDPNLFYLSLSPSRSLVITASIREDLSPKGVYITNEDNTRSIRTAPYSDGNRLLIVTGETYTPDGSSISDRYDALSSWLSERWPDAQSLMRWSAEDYYTPDGLPLVGRVSEEHPNVYVAAGFGGWGMTNGVMSSKLIVSLIAEQPQPWTDLYDPRRLMDVTLEDGQLPELAPGDGVSVKIGSTPVAVYRDDNNEVQLLSAKCTHFGCQVQFNDAEKTWECPCHGSRFALDGSVIQGPARHPLSPLDDGEL